MRTRTVFADKRRTQRNALRQPSNSVLDRVVVIPSWFPNRVQPLLGTFVQDQVRALAATFPNIEWHVIAADAPEEWVSPRRPFAGAASYLRSWHHAGASAVEEDGNVLVHRVRALHGSFALGLLGFAPHKRIVERSLQRIEREYGAIDLIHAHSCYPAGLVVAALRPACPWVLTEHQSPFPFVELRGADGLLWPELGAVFPAADATIAVSRSQARDIERFTSIKPSVIPNVCDESQFVPRQGRVDGPFTFLTVSGLNEQKGIDVLLAAIAEFRSRGGNARFRIAGSGPLESQLRAQALSLGLSEFVEWCGAVSRADLPDVFRSADAFVLPSRHESFGVAYIEALASGLPIIATRCGGPEDIVRDVNGVLVPIDDVQALADAMCAMVGARYDAQGIRQDFLSRFAREPVCRDIVALYQSLG